MALDNLIGLEQSRLMPNYRRFRVEFVRGSGCTLWDDAGNSYLDLLAGIAVDNVGHCHQGVVEAVRRQAGELIHVSNLFYTSPAMELAERLSRSSIGGRVFFCNSGAEANEAAIKLARRHRPGGRILSLQGGFHGRTMGALSATPQEDKQAPFAPLVPGFDSVAAEPAQVSAAVSAETAAVIVEPIQGEAGVHVVGDDVLVAAREACDRHGSLLIFDEVQTGAGRTGSLWGFEGTPVVPDAITVAKGIGGGLPIGALITSADVETTLEVGDHGSTFGGGPVVCSAALAVMDVLEEDGFLDGVSRKGTTLAEGLASIPGVVAVRGRGLMIGADIDGDAAGLVGRALAEERLVINATGPATLRLIPPLVITDEEIADAISRLARLLETQPRESA